MGFAPPLETGQQNAPTFREKFVKWRWPTRSRTRQKRLSTGDLMEKRRQLMDKWAQFISKALSTVVQLERA